MLGTGCSGVTVGSDQPTELLGGPKLGSPQIFSLFGFLGHVYVPLQLFQEIGQIPAPKLISVLDDEPLHRRWGQANLGSKLLLLLQVSLEGTLQIRQVLFYHRKLINLIRLYHLLKSVDIQPVLLDLHLFQPHLFPEILDLLAQILFLLLGLHQPIQQIHHVLLRRTDGLLQNGYGSLQFLVSFLQVPNVSLVLFVAPVLVVLLASDDGFVQRTDKLLSLVVGSGDSVLQIGEVVLLRRGHELH